MEKNEIKLACEEAYKQIRDAEQRLKELRAICKHEETFEGNWSWRPGVIEPAIICSDCGSLIKYLNQNWVDIAQNNF